MSVVQNASCKPVLAAVLSHAMPNFLSPGLIDGTGLQSACQQSADHICRAQVALVQDSPDVSTAISNAATIVHMMRKLTTTA